MLRCFRGIDEPLNIIVFNEIIDNMPFYALAKTLAQKMRFFKCDIAFSRKCLVICCGNKMWTEYRNHLTQLPSDDKLNYLAINHISLLSKVLFNWMPSFSIHNGDLSLLILSIYIIDLTIVKKPLFCQCCKLCSILTYVDIFVYSHFNTANRC